MTSGKEDKRMEEFFNEKQFKLHGEYGFCVGGLIVGEFAFILNHVTEGKLDSFNNFSAIKDDCQSIIHKIEFEMSKQSPVAPIGDLENVRFFLRCISEYVRLAQELGFPINPLLESQST